MSPAPCIDERWSQAVADARLDHAHGYDLAEIKLWAKIYALPAWVICGDAAEVLHGKQRRCEVIEWVCAPTDGDEIWLPWLGCHVAPPQWRCPVCSHPDCDEGWAPCSHCGHDGRRAASIVIAEASEEHRAAIKAERHASAKARCQQRKLARQRKLVGL